MEIAKNERAYFLSVGQEDNRGYNGGTPIESMYRQTSIRNHRPRELAWKILYPFIKAITIHEILVTISHFMTNYVSNRDFLIMALFNY